MNSVSEFLAKMKNWEEEGYLVDVDKLNFENEKGHFVSKTLEYAPNKYHRIWGSNSYSFLKGFFEDGCLCPFIIGMQIHKTRNKETHISHCEWILEVHFGLNDELRPLIDEACVKKGLYK